MNTRILIARSIANSGTRSISSPAFFPASAVGDEIGNYAIASAGTITSKSSSDDSGNLNTATESVCPKGWTLPTTNQTKNNRDVINFSPVLGGSYLDGILHSEVSHGFWWGSEAYNGANRYYLDYHKNDSKLTSYNGRRDYGIYIRCVSEEKTVTDLTYLQKKMVAETGLEPVRVAPFDFKSNAYTNSATRPPLLNYIIYLVF